MQFRVAFYLTLFLFSVSPLLAQNQPKWLSKMKQVKLLSHTYEDVLKIMGKPSDGTNEKELIESFDFKDGRISVVFASGLCVETSYSDGKLIGWKVPEYTAITVAFYPEKNLKAKNIGINLEGFTRTQVRQSVEATPDDNRRAPFLFQLVNEDLGIYLFEEFGKISIIRFQPAKQYDYLTCEN